MSEYLCSRLIRASYIFQELLTGGDLYSYLDFRGQPGLSDAETTVIIRQLLEAVKYVHAHYITHRDIKPENILMASWRSGGRIVLTDFGTAKRIVPTASQPQQPLKRRMHTKLGTFGYAAPEMHCRDDEEGYGPAVDMWSVGAVTATLLTAEPIRACFASTSDRACHPASQRVLAATTAEVRYDLRVLDDAHNQLWGPVGRRPKDFLKKLLALDESHRPTAREALEHSWFTNKLYRTELEMLYQRAIEGWKPGPQVDIETINTQHLGPGPLEDESVLEIYGATVSAHFVAPVSV